ncbi:putative fumarylacetoacetate hydrolase [Xylogone sp. PMI_703]|nr:putative fumarylacetoacetate hydrolase [Xylogone sp. PMI_703]
MPSELNGNLVVNGNRSAVGESGYTNYCAYISPDTKEQQIGHLDLTTQQITPLSFKSGAQLSDLYQVIEATEANIVPSGTPLNLSDVKLLPPISGRDILAVGKNYAEHAKEFNSSGFDSSDKNDQPTHPVIFTKRATSIIAHGEQVLLHPKFTETADYEGEIGVIIGKPGFQIPESEAMNHVWGYTIINDLTARERQRDHKQFFIGKSPDTFCPIGPIAVPKEHLPQNLRVQTFVNNEKRQDATIDQLIFSIPRLIHDLSLGQTLQLGDTLATGTPVGVGFGFRPMKFLKAGDEVKIAVTGLGELVNTIASVDSPNTTLAHLQSQSHIPIANIKTRGKEGLVNVGGKDIFYQIRGKQDGPAVIFIHGLGASSSYFEPIVAKLESTHALHMFDLEGHGLSPTSALSALSVSSFASDVQGIFKLSNIQNATVVAHSLGCLIALKFTLDNPELVSQLVLMGPPPSPLPEAGSKGAYARAATVRSKGMLSVVDAIIGGATSPHTKKENSLALAAIRLSLLGQDPEGYAKACMALAGSVSLILDVSQLKCKTLIVTGSHDMVGPVKVCERYVEQIKSSELKVLEDVGHWHLFEDAKQASEIVSSFI